MAHQDGGTSVANLAHWAKNIKSGEFNDKKGKKYNLSGLSELHTKITTRIFYSDSDRLVTEEGIEKLKSVLPESERVKYRRVLGLGHDDFLWSENSREKIYDEILAAILENSDDMGSREEAERSSESRDRGGERNGSFPGHLEGIQWATRPGEPALNFDT